MNLDKWVLIVTVIGVVISTVAAWAAIASARLTRTGLDKQDEGLAKQEEQLRLERELASMIPKLEVSKIGFSDPRPYEEVSDTLRERDQAIRREQEERQRQEERRHREKKRREVERRR